MNIDLCVNVSSADQLESFRSHAEALGFTGFAVSNIINVPHITCDDGFRLIKRATIRNTTLSGLKRHVQQVRRHVLIVAIPITSIQLANWAAGDARVDLLSLSGSKKEQPLHLSTAKLAAATGTILEIQIASLLLKQGLDRSRVIKLFRESIGAALSAKMPVVFSSGAADPLMIRSHRALLHIAQLLGIDPSYFKVMQSSAIEDMVTRNLKKLSPNFIAPGIEIVGATD